MIQLMSLGCDPEVFLKRNNNFISAFGLVQGNKQNPYPLLQGAVQVDGMALEFNIEPAKNVNEFISNITTVLAQIRQAIPSDIEFDSKCTVHMTTDYLMTRQPEEVEMGCDPDFNAYTFSVNPRPDQARPMRTAGGHVHIGLGSNLDIGDMDVQYEMNKVIQLMDIYLGVPSVILDQDVERRSMYGKAGACRYKSYGVEYRSLSNFWVHDTALMAWVFQQSELAVSQLANYEDIIAQAGDVQSIINNSDINAAQALVAKLNICMP